MFSFVRKTENIAGRLIEDVNRGASVRDELGVSKHNPNSLQYWADLKEDTFAIKRQLER